MTDTKALFDAIRTIKGSALTQADVDLINSVLQGSGGVRRISATGLALLKEFEGCRLVAYRDTGGVLTIGYGSTGPHVKAGMRITQEEAEALLKKDLDRFEKGVARLAPVATQNQFDAMVSLAFNIGLSNFEKSTVRKTHNAGATISATKAFAFWNKDNGKVLPGLVRRRAAEAELYAS